MGILIQNFDHSRQNDGGDRKVVTAICQKIPSKILEKCEAKHCRPAGDDDEPNLRTPKMATSFKKLLLDADDHFKNMKIILAISSIKGGDNRNVVMAKGGNILSEIALAVT
jgi:hypothetical protein